jgi:D-alanine-D-alanine ligase
VLADLRSFSASLPDPRLIVKPARLGSSIGVAIVHDPAGAELEACLDYALRFDDLALVEPYLDHPRELEVSVIGNHRGDLQVFGPGEVVPRREFYDFVAKYRDDGSRTDTQAVLDPVLREDARRIAGEVYLATGCTGFARIDFLLAKDDLLVVSEINTIPGFTPISLFPRMCAEGGYDFPGICERIVELALERAAGRRIRRLTRADLP